MINYRHGQDQSAIASPDTLENSLTLWVIFSLTFKVVDQGICI
ncbi:hypothetical protein [Coleofasciculus sp. F4-SAH-05]